MCERDFRGTESETLLLMMSRNAVTLFIPAVELSVQIYPKTSTKAVGGNLQSLLGA